MYKSVIASCKVSMPLLAFLLFCQVAAANLCGDEDRVLLQEDKALKTPALELPVEKVEHLMRSIYSVRTNKFTPCTGVAISPTLVLLANHCFKKDEANAYQNHLVPQPEPIALRKFVRSNKEMQKELPIIFSSDANLVRMFEEIERQKINLLDFLIDFAIFERMEGEFEHFIEADFFFDFSTLADSDQFGVAGLPVFGEGKLGLKQAKLWFSPVTGLAYDDARSYSQRVLDEMDLAKQNDYPKTWNSLQKDDRPTPEQNGSVVSFCADIFKGNSGSPLIRFQQTGSGWELSVVAVVSRVPPKEFAAGFPNTAATALSFSWVEAVVSRHLEEDNL